MRHAISLLVLLAAGLSLSAFAADPPDYRPSTSDLMTGFIQPRHAKLFLAGQARNWDLAEYERHNLGGAFARMAAAAPKIGDAATGDLIAAFVMPPLADLETAIKAKDDKAFQQAFDTLTAGCNGCHQATGHPVVMLKRPAGDPYPDQDFGPPR
jgi:hypothetical protein